MQRFTRLTKKHTGVYRNQQDSIGRESRGVSLRYTPANGKKKEKKQKTKQQKTNCVYPKCSHTGQNLRRRGGHVWKATAAGGAGHDGGA